MKKSNITSLELIDNAIAKLYAAKEALLSNLLSEKVKPYHWVIDESTGNPVYFQVQGVSASCTGFVVLTRYNKKFTFSKDEFNKKFRSASKAEIEQHERYLAGKKQLVERPISKSELWTKLVNDICDLSKDELTMIINHVELKKGNHYEIQMDKLKKINNVIKVTSVPAYDMNGSTTPPPSDLPDFYMVTVRGLMGTKKRYETYEDAEKEAKRLAKLENHRAHIMGVIAVVDPVVTTELNVTKK